MLILDPFKQFAVHRVIDISLLGVDLSITNSTISMFMAIGMVILVSWFFILSIELIPSRWQIVGEFLYKFIMDMGFSATGKRLGIAVESFLATFFLYILFSNFLGLVPYGFTLTSHISVTLTLGFLAILGVILVGFKKQGFGFLSVFLPSGVPLFIAPFIIVIEFVAFFTRPITLGLRLMANMVAGHVLVKVLASFIVMILVSLDGLAAFFLGSLPFILVVLLLFFECFIALLQAYIFTILVSMYFRDAVIEH